MDAARQIRIFFFASAFHPLFLEKNLNKDFMQKIVFLIFFIIFGNLFAKEEFIFRQKTGESQSFQKWSLEEEKGNLKAVCVEDDGVTSMEWLPNNELKKYIFKSKNELKNFDLELKGKNLFLTFFKNNKIQKKKFSLKKPWVQQFSFGLKNFILSKNNSLDFCLVNPHNFDLQHMVVKKKEVQNINISGKKYEAQKVIISLAGFKGAFWKAELWFEKNNATFLKYRANSGPNTPMSTILLESKKESKKALFFK